MSIKQKLANKDFTQYLNVPDHLKDVSYGTTGYRMRHDLLDGISVRVAVLAALRSIFMNKTVGLMITASHNPECDNGIKVIDPNGDMLPNEWEKIAMEMVKWDDIDFSKNLLKKCEELEIKFMDNYKGKVFVGSDTRRSCGHISDLVRLALNTVGCEVILFESVTTPQLHFYVKLSNNRIINNISEYSNYYFERLTTAFCKDKVLVAEPAILNVDCANGVGATQLLPLSKMVSDHLKLVLYNTSTDNLNLDCGADHVKINQSIPIIHNYEKIQDQSLGRWCTIDGDADRLLYFYTSESKVFQLLDGDRMAVLIADFLSRLLRSELNAAMFTFGIIQTAYANSASTQFIENVLKIETKCVPTGVKHLHQAAKEFDIGIYFEANGHGTVLFSEKVRNYSHTLNDNHELRRLIDMVNEADGDAISDILVIEHILHVKKWNLEQWSSMYEDYPSRQLKVAIKDRSAIVTMDAERKVKSPVKLQCDIDDAIHGQLKSGLKHSRAFVRPSGTEDIVRVYCESSTQQDADNLAEQIATIIRNTL